MKRLRNFLIGWFAAFVCLLLRMTCRLRCRHINDLRANLRAAGTPYVFALLHAHQLAAAFANDEGRGRIASMVSRSRDGDLIVPTLKVCGVRVVRGSSRKGGEDKGGRAALAELRTLLEKRIVVLITVDGPRGPRGSVRRGVPILARQVQGTVVIPVIVLPSRRWIIARTWDRMQIPKPFAKLRVIYGEPITPEAEESSGDLRDRIAAALAGLELEHDPEEGA